MSSVDLLLIHWPNPKRAARRHDARAYQAKRDGRAKHIGIANFTLPLIEEAVKLSAEPLVTNQIEVHPYLDQSKVIAACRRHGLSVTAYCPLARGKAPDDEVLTRIGNALGKTASQVALRWLVQQDIVVDPAQLQSGQARRKSRDLRFCAERGARWPKSPRSSGRTDGWSIRRMLRSGTTSGFAGR